MQRADRGIWILGAPFIFYTIFLKIPAMNSPQYDKMYFSAEKYRLSLSFLHPEPVRIIKYKNQKIECSRTLSLGFK